MSQLRKTIVFSLFFIVIIAIAAWFYGTLSKTEQTSIVEETKNLFPFGDTGNRGGSQNQGGQGSIEGQEGTEKPKPVPEPEPEKKAQKRLRKVSDQSISGFKGFERNEAKEIQDITIDSSGESVYSTKEILVEKDYLRYSNIDGGTIFQAKIDPYGIETQLLIENYIPNIEHAYFSQDANSFIFQYWDKDDQTVESYQGNIQAVEYVPGVCTTKFETKINVGDENEEIFKLHEFLNRTAQTKVSSSGINSPGNESFLATESTITAIKNFQSLHNLEIDGKIGPATRKLMLELCNKQEDVLARAEYNKLERVFTTEGFFLNQNIESVNIDKKGNRYFYLENIDNIIKGYIREFNENEKIEVFSSPFTEWISSWGSENEIELTTKAHSEYEGYSYSLNLEDKEYHKRADGKKGLTTLAGPNKNIILSSYTNNEGDLELSLHNRQTGRYRKLDIQTLPEKCVWTSNARTIYCAVPTNMEANNYPEHWYQGRELFKDELWKIHTTTYEIEKIDSFENELNEDIDVEKIALSENENYLYFINKDNEHLWSYRLLDL